MTLPMIGSGLAVRSSECTALNVCILTVLKFSHTDPDPEKICSLRR